MKRIFILEIIFTLFTVPAFSQGIFDEHFNNCGGKTPCFYCGDTVAHYTKNFGNYIDTEVKNAYNYSRYAFKNFDVAYEVYVDSMGCTCVVSGQSVRVNWSLLLKDDIRKWLNNMPDWKPAIRNGQPINSSVVLEIKCRNSSFEVKYVRPPAPKPKIVVPNEYTDTTTAKANGPMGQADTTTMKTDAPKEKTE